MISCTKSRMLSCTSCAVLSRIELYSRSIPKETFHDNIDTEFLVIGRALYRTRLSSDVQYYPTSLPASLTRKKVDGRIRQGVQLRCGQENLEVTKR